MDTSRDSEPAVVAAPPEGDARGGSAMSRGRRVVYVLLLALWIVVVVRFWGFWAQPEHRGVLVLWIPATFAFAYRCGRPRRGSPGCRNLGAEVSSAGPCGNGRGIPIMLAMTSSTAAAATRRLILVPASPRADRGDAAVRRFRLARLRLEGREVARAQRFDHVKRTYD